MNPIATSRALWNRSRVDLRSDEILAQLLDRGDISDQRALYRLAKEQPELRARILAVVRGVPVFYGRLWLAALADLGEPVDVGQPLPKVELDV